MNMSKELEEAEEENRRARNLWGDLSALVGCTSVTGSMELSIVKDALSCLQLPIEALKMCHERDWSLHWTHRGAYLHLEVSELIEAIRGKRGNPVDEAADVLIVLMSITENHLIDWTDVLTHARQKIKDKIAEGLVKKDR